MHPAAPRGWVDWVVRSSFPGLDFLSILIGGGWPLRRITWLKNKKGAVRPMVGGTAPGKTLTAASKLRPGGFGEES